jgi:hypothetical protein
MSAEVVANEAIKSETKADATLEIEKKIEEVAKDESNTDKAKAK